MFKIATWNVNSIRARQNIVQNWLQEKEPDVVLLQELKCMDADFPYNIFEELNYNVSAKCQKSYNGVAIASKYVIDEVKDNFFNNPCPLEARFIEVTMQTPIGYGRIISVYVPNGGVDNERYELKLDFLRALKEYLVTISNRDEILLVGGDFNVAPENMDVYDHQALNEVVCFKLEERKLMRGFLNNNLADLYRLAHPHKQEFTWWDYRAGAANKNEGMRIDFLLSNYKLLKYLNYVEIHKGQRSLEKASDHAPVFAGFSLNTIM